MSVRDAAYPLLMYDHNNHGPISLFTYIIIRNPLTNLPLHTHTVQYVVLDV